MYDRYSAAIYARLEEDQVLDPDNQVYMGLLRLHNSTRDGYSVLKSILAATLLADIRNISVLSTPPTASPGTDPFLYAASLKEFFSHQAQLERHYHHKEQATMYLQAMQQQPKYTAAATQVLHDLEQLKLANNQDLPATYGVSQLPVAMVTHQGVLCAEPPTATLNVTQLTRPASDQVNETLSSDYRHGPSRTPANRNHACGIPKAPMVCLVHAIKRRRDRKFNARHAAQMATQLRSARFFPVCTLAWNILLGNRHRHQSPSSNIVKQTTR
jgi:hypothetical protein